MEQTTGWEDFFEEPTNLKESKGSTLVVDLTVLPEMSTEELKEALSTIPLEVVLTKDESKRLDKYGKCPNCNTNWDAGDIFEELCKKEVLSLIGDATKMAAMYGWTAENKKRFTKVSTHVIKDRDICMCHNCAKFIATDTSIIYSTLLDVEENNPFVKLRR